MANFIEAYCAQVRLAGAAGVIAKPVVVAQNGTYAMHYVPSEYLNAQAHLVLVSTTPGHAHVRLAAAVTEELMRTHAPGRVIQRENKRRVELGGKLVRPNLIRMLDHFRVPELVGLPHAAALWNDGFERLQPLALLPHATTRRGLAFDGPLEELQDVPMLREVFETRFLGAVRQMRTDALYIALGRTAWAGLRHAVSLRLLARHQLLGMMPVPARAGSMVRYFLREIAASALSAKDPVRHRVDWLDAAHAELEANVRKLRAAINPDPRSTYLIA
ncbi:hypothetical protein BJN34_20765 [Cupriavidus necator]|uniref:Uncharacterized protein n=1 Tax=Cupriavidus necator TaxID=106590 RepID=A0A1U9UVN1_CUPNE|nr:hypothetical protein [Cupriavidus necator]AQV96311.1 hypothetical protein BJN34_20765 [Cupriavidus necator]